MPSSNFIINKSLFKKVNGFNKDIWPGEDTDLCYRINKIEKYTITQIFIIFITEEVQF